MRVPDQAELAGGGPFVQAVLLDQLGIVDALAEGRPHGVQVHSVAHRSSAVCARPPERPAAP